MLQDCDALRGWGADGIPNLKHEVAFLVNVGIRKPFP